VSRARSSRPRGRAVRRSAAAIVRGSVRRAANRLPKDIGVEPLDIGRLVSPLRYDVLIRADFFGFLDANLDLYRRDFPRFSRRAREELAEQDRAVLLDHYDQRLRRSHALWVSFLEHGFDARHPVTLRRAHPEAHSESGLHIDRLIHLGDGCHRLALLLASGERLLPPENYRIDRRPQRVVLDNTTLLVRALRLEEKRYARFLSLHYADGPHDDLDSLIQHVRDRRPAALAELCSVIGQHRIPEWEHPERR
jgi:hypothetical protein